MLRTIILGPQRELAEEIYSASTHCESFDVYGAHYEYPPYDRLIQILSRTDPQAAFIEVDSTPEALVIMREIRKTIPDIALVGYTSEDEKRISPVDGLCEVVRGPFTPEKVESAIVRAIEKNTVRRRDNVFAFLPAKAGSGATLTAMNVAGALSYYWQQKVLVIEADLHSGYIGIALKIEPERTVVEALENSESLSDRSWKHLVHEAHGVDWLLTERRRNQRRIPPWEYQRLLTFASSRYDTVIVDLPEVINEATQTIVQRATKVFVVTTPEVPSLYLARRRLGDLGSRGVEQFCQRIVLNRFTEEENVLEVYEQVLGRGIDVTIRNDYSDVQRAAMNSGLINRRSELVNGYFAIAEVIAPGEPVKPAPDNKPAKKRESVKRLLETWVKPPGSQP